MTATESSQWLSNPRNNARIMSAWDEFLGGGTPSPSTLRHLIVESWARSLTAQVDPGCQYAAPPLDGDALEQLYKQHADLLLASRPVMAMARDFLVETGSIMILTDPDGTILSIEGDERAHDAAASIRLIEGCSWNEEHTGTNAIGTALSVGAPVQVHAAEHFCSGIKGWTCAAAVIHHPYDNQILGVIDISGLSKTFTPHSLALVATTASRIESQLAKQELKYRYRLLEQGMARMAGTTDGIIICDRHGHPIKINEYAKPALEARGIALDLGKSSRLSSLSLDPQTAETSAAPAWHREDWVEPMLSGGERIGTVLTIPASRLGSTSAHASHRQGTATRFASHEARGFDAIKGQSPRLLEAVEKARRLARINVPVLLLGETGAGKENFARGMHIEGDTRNQPFVALNCGGLSPDLLSSELFGYGEGAFTGARRGGMTGKLEAASGGTLFLDEIGEMPLELQPHLLRVLEEGEIYRVGESTPRKVSFKLIAATNRELRDEVAEGRFRMDLYYRLSVTSIRLPPLRDCRDDIPLLARHFLQKFAKQYRIPEKVIDHEAMTVLQHYHWPGNVRELRNTIESMILMSGSDILALADLPPELLEQDAPHPSPFPRSPDTGSSPLSSGSDRPSGNLQSTELAAIQIALAAEHGNLTLAARHLGIARSTLYAKVKKFGMEAALCQLRGSETAPPMPDGTPRHDTPREGTPGLPPRE